WKIRKPAAAPHCTVNRLAPGPLMVTFLSINNSPLTRLIVGRPVTKLIVSPPEGDALRIACRSVPTPLSPGLVTIRVVARAVAAPKSRAIATDARKEPVHPRN